MDECCCTPTGPPLYQLARAVSILTVLVFQINTGIPFFCGRRFFRQCNVTSVDNGRCGFALPNQDTQVNIPIFTTNPGGLFDPCVTLEQLRPSPPFTGVSDIGMGCRLSVNAGFDCWDALYMLSIETTINDLVAACLSNLALLDLNQIPLGWQRTIVNDSFNGNPVGGGDVPLDSNPPPPAACPPPFGYRVASSLAVRYAGPGEGAFCTNTHERRIIVPTHIIIVSASRSRFTSNANWCKRTLFPIHIDPDFVNTCNSQNGACAESDCKNYLPATGIIDVPPLNTTIQAGICSAPALPCNQVPIAF